MAISPQRAADLKLIQELRDKGFHAEADELIDAINAKRWITRCKRCKTTMSTMVRPSQEKALLARGWGGEGVKPGTRLPDTALYIASYKLGGAPLDVDGEPVIDCPKCGVARRAQKVQGTYSEKKTCNARCLASMGPTCECSCAGKNHGASWSV